MEAHGYESLARVHDGGQAIVYRARRVADGRPVMLKMLRGPYPTAEARARFRSEYELTRAVAGPGVVEVEDWVHDGGIPIIVLEDFGARSLDRLFAKGPPPLARGLAIAVSIVQAIQRVHAARVLHLDINPANIVVAPDAHEVKLIDFGLASDLPRQTAELRSAQVLQGTLRYVAPEQTGRTNRSIDYRSDFYSLGATLYWLFTGRAPFESDDPLALVHAHIARRPDPPHRLRPAVPEVLSAVVLKLLEKDAEERYQSAYGVLADLAFCQDLLAGEVDGDGFTPGGQDRPAWFRIPERLYGREPELAQLFEAFDRVRDGAREVVLVEGSSGMGKTALVREVQRPIGERGGVFVAGKFEQFKRDIPYHSLAQALRQFVQLLLTGQQGDVDRWRDRMAEAVGGNARLLTELIPELEHVLGELPPVEALPPLETAARLHRTVQRFVRVLATADHPLVLFMDDLQWADLPSIGLLRVLASDPRSSHTLIIGAIRHEEVGAGHPLRALLQELGEAGVPVHTARLRPLVVEDVSRLLADTLQRPPAEVAELAAAAREKTAGNPFFLHRFLLSLARGEQLRFETERGQWSWDLDAIRALDVTDNVVAFLAARLRQLPADALAPLVAAAVLGNVFDLGLLSGILGESSETLGDHLGPSLREGLIEEVPAAGGERRFRFQHDRIQQAAYEQADPARLRALHRAAGERLLDRADEPGEEDDLFEIVNHLNAGVGPDLSAKARLRLVELDHVAGLRALSASAYAPAARYLGVARHLLGAAGWAQHPAVTRAVTESAARVAYLTTDYAAMEALVAEAIAHADDDLHRVRAMRVRIDARIAQNRTAEAIAVGLEALALLGIDLPPEPVESDVGAGLLATFQRLEGVDLARVAGRRPPDDPSVRLAMNLISTLAPPAYFINPMLVPLLAFELVRMTVEDGPTSDSAYGFSLLGLVLCNVGKLDEGYAFGRLAMDLAARFEDKRLRVRATHVFYGFTRHWKEPGPVILPDYAELFHQAVDVGDFEYAAYAGMMYAIFGFYMGADLARLEPSVAFYTGAMRETRQEASLAVHGILHQAILNVTGRSEDPLVLTGEVYDEPAMLALFEELRDPTCLFVLHCVKAMLAGLFGKWGRTLELVDVCRGVEAGGGATLHLVMLETWDALASLAVARDVPPDQRASLRTRAAEALGKLDAWAAHNPAAHGHRPVLVRAELAALEGDRQAAMDGFEQAAGMAREAGLVWDEALAHQRAGELFDALGLATVARAYLLEARYAWERWGGRAIVDDLQARFPAHLGDVAVAARGADVTRSLDSTVTLDLDVMAVIRSSQAISKEIQLDQLIAAIVRIAMEVSGAARCLVVSNQPAGLTVTAAGVAEPEPHVDQAPVLLRGAGLGPEGIIRYVQRTREELVLDDAAASALFASDPYVSERGVQSVLCLPIEQQGRLLAVLYLEHASSRAVFSQQRVALLRVLLAQAAISVENAMLVDNLEEKVRERTRELEAARELAERAMERSDELLRNVLPDAVAEELKQSGRARPVSYESATVVFTDFVGFTRYAADTRPEELVGELERCFGAFDEMAVRWGVERLKTIGDAWMGVAGVPARCPTHAVDCVMLALEIQRFMAGSAAAPAPFDIRIGIHSGPLVAGVIGTRRFAYDVWGDTVNTAARMEARGVPGRVNISSDTWALVKDFFVATHRGALDVKGKGAVEMVFVDGLRPELASPRDPLVPGEGFYRLRARRAAR